MTTSETSALRVALDAIASDAKTYFDAASYQCQNVPEQNGFFYQTLSEHYWGHLDSLARDESVALIDRLLKQAATVAKLAETAPLAGKEDVDTVQKAVKSMRAALSLRRYTYHAAEVLHDQDRVLGLRPATQSEIFPQHPDEAKKEFMQGHTQLASVLALVEAGGELEAGNLPSGPAPTSTRYRAGTAFIMMWIDPTQPELSDVVDVVKEAFGKFDIKAIRADDIEHEGRITDRVLSEIQTSEFLFADLSGSRPNVYYEVGFAHALGKRVILFRKAGTGIHFDLANYNCPDYENLRDLREKLTRRLVEITNRNPSNEEA